MRLKRIAATLTALPVIALSAQGAAELVGGGTVSTPHNELNSAFTRDGRTMYFTRTAGAGGRLGVIMVSTLARGRWSEPRVADFSGRYSDFDPVVAPDETGLYFISRRPRSGNEPRGDFDIWVVERTGAAWGTPRNLGPEINGDGDELYPWLAADGTLYFSSCGRTDSRGRCDLYRSQRRDGRHRAVENLGDSINTPASETDAYVAPDQSYIVFTAYGRADAVGDGDLYVSIRRGGSWSSPRRLDARINSITREYCPVISPDGRYLYFTSQRGFPDDPLRRSLSSTELRDSLGSPRNGFGNIYRIVVSAIPEIPRR